MELPDLERYTALDTAGFLPGVGESIADFEERIRAVIDAQREFEEELSANGEVTVFGEFLLKASERIPAEIIAEADELTEKLYAFRSDHVPGFFLSRNIGPLWGGCMVSDTELPFSFFLIRGAFRKRPRWFLYNRKELLSHELCHWMRQSLHDVPLEEFFAYRTSPSRLRRYIGNCFIRDRDALLFVIPVFVLLGAVLIQSFYLPSFWVWPFWIMALSYPGYLFFRNAKARHWVFKAEKKLRLFGVQTPLPVLFRATTPEIREIGELADIESFRAYLDSKDELRWQIIRHRFLAM
ncbi:MAG: hypothetical protein LBM70_09115 [Victivallales bacterium]|jgi:hypothetical protein|nr:hypothetical protein [Victivallales bacterium]